MLLFVVGSVPTKDVLVSNDTIRNFNTTDYNPITMKVLFAITTLLFVSCATTVYGIRKRPTRQCSVIRGKEDKNSILGTPVYTSPSVPCCCNAWLSPSVLAS